MNPKVKEFRKRAAELPREELLELIREQDPELVKQIRRVEWVFENKLNHLTWSDGEPIEGREFTNEELALILDPPFMVDERLLEAGINVDQQKQLHIASDVVLWGKNFLGIKPRVYQILVLRDPSNRRVLRFGRRAGKTWILAILALHYSYTTKNGRVLVMAPMKSQVALIYDEVMKLVQESEAVSNAISRNVTSPQYEINFTTGASVRFFTTGLKTGSKADVARGQEAHVIILDEMDYMGVDDIDALYAMLQRTDENQPEKLLIAASTPTGRRERFYEWCTTNKYFKEFYFPSYCSPLWDQELEEEMRDIYSELAYRHEIEADWGEDAEGVYPRKYIEAAFKQDWPYQDARTSARSTYIIGADWDKYGAGPNICVLEYCHEDHELEWMQNRLRVAHREEIPRNEFVLTEAVQRIIKLNEKFQPAHIYVDRGAGETQVELLRKHGVDHPETKLKERVKGVSFSETVEVKDPATKQPDKKHIKPFMVDNLRNLLEDYRISFPERDEELYMQLISYIVVRTTATGRPVFEASGSQQDHAHDALILACLAFTQNYGDLMKMKYATKARSFSGDILNPSPDGGTTRGGDGEKESSGRQRVTRSGVSRSARRSKHVSRKMF